MWNMKSIALTVQKLLARFKFSKSRPNCKVKVTRLNLMVPIERSCHLAKLVWNIKARALNVQKLLARIICSKSGPISKVKDTGSKYWHPRKGLVTRNTHVKYESSSTHFSKFISKVYLYINLGGHENLLSKEL